MIGYGSRIPPASPENKLSFIWIGNKCLQLGYTYKNQLVVIYMWLRIPLLARNSRNSSLPVLIDSQHSTPPLNSLFSLQSLCLSATFIDAQALSETALMAAGRNARAGMRTSTRAAPRRGQVKAAIARSVVHAFASIVHKTLISVASPRSYSRHSSRGLVWSVCVQNEQLTYKDKWWGSFQLREWGMQFFCITRRMYFRRACYLRVNRRRDWSISACGVHALLQPWWISQDYNCHTPHWQLQSYNLRVKKA